ncbi:Uncharacterized protein OS=Granulicella tundricola (strain ATCC BAA-1859 / DSM 23138 / MP5ACTX9) GN=AciX9_0251 PE=4 SV=1 [Gemmataceae bacterium]|nr:Uncharacterized protein OS=Granulicella tundricola (strain ATCC BAA-1859 / DSM 23138 / MP5ACTX9) GN=AciX9_0251 PE=4 SV=1 [Gemmataceae bacterium]VTU00681.1 Uncharacterized protein OS=Granulicella tundricola (strain ATCC BAA-1859 / DSM 23138 / MP5ACTX9) GN=AciX9_0251 PE=4 SV=1 [Gemmataceae bacterium]
MSLHTDLLKQAERLAGLEPKHPKQASLRRAISAAYYALFHMLIHEATTLLVSDPALLALVPRAFNHGEMRSGCEQFLDDKKLPKHLSSVIGAAIPGDLKVVATAFVLLQQRRHEADYDVARTLNRADALTVLRIAKDAFEAWERVRGQQAATVFLANLLLGSKWKR